jgi:hypothetical protein
MDDYDDYAREEWISSLYSDFAKDVLARHDDLYGEVINQFTSERLQSYYVENPRVIGRALWSLGEARSLLATHPSAALVLAVTAAEVGLKSGLLKPILHGLVHDDVMAVSQADRRAGEVRSGSRSRRPRSAPGAGRALAVSRADLERLTAIEDSQFRDRDHAIPRESMTPD